MKISSAAGKRADPSVLLNVPTLITASRQRVGNPIAGIKVIAENGWFRARPSGTEEIYTIYPESFLGRDRLRQIEEKAQTIVSETLARSTRAA